MLQPSLPNNASPVGLPLLNGLDAGQQLGERHQKIKVVYPTQNRDPNLAAESFRRNASEYLLKSSSAPELSLAIREAVRGTPPRHSNPGRG